LPAGTVLHPDDVANNTTALNTMTTNLIPAP
jgi:hypothetical protein